LLGVDVEYRVLSRAEIGRFVEVDRTEAIDSIYYLRDGRLSLEVEHWDVKDWSASEKKQRIAGLQERYDSGDTLFGAFDGTTLAGVSVLGQHPLPSAMGRFNLAGLWVSHPYRGKGIGRRLVDRVMEKARELEARKLYVSATPSENTVRFYMSIGFRLADPVDPDLFQEEPEDIHLELIL
jgi:GNAT superfamily N-acetyltransferase